MTDTLVNNTTSEGKCGDRVSEDKTERRNEINASPDPNWTKSRAHWVRSKSKQRGVQEDHVAEYFSGCDDS